MATFRHFRDLEAWKTARRLTNVVYDLGDQERFFKNRALRDQVRRAAISVASNIAEGSERDGNAEFRHLLSIAKGSAAEVECQLLIASDRRYISQEECDRAAELALTVRRQISRLITYLAESDYKGRRFVRDGDADHGAHPADGVTDAPTQSEAVGPGQPGAWNLEPSEEPTR